MAPITQIGHHTVNELGRFQNMAPMLTFAGKHGWHVSLEDRLIEIKDDDTSDVEYSPDDHSEDDNDDYSYDSDDSSDGGDFPDIDAPVEDPSAPALGEAPGNDDDISVQSQSTQGGPLHPENPGVDQDKNNYNEEDYSDSESDDSSYQPQSDQSEPDDSSWQSQSHTSEQAHKSTGVEYGVNQSEQSHTGEQVHESTGVEDGLNQSEQPHESTGVQSHEGTVVQDEHIIEDAGDHDDDTPTSSDLFEQAADSGRLAVSQQNNACNL